MQLYVIPKDIRHLTPELFDIFRYFGPPPSNSVITSNTSVVYLKDMCNAPKQPNNIHGSIVVAALDDIICPLSSTYRLMESEGAVALVLVAFYKPSGILHFLSDDPRDAKCCDNRNMIMVDTSKYDFPGYLRDGSEQEDMWAVIKLPHVTIYEDMFESYVWIILVQVLVPALAFYTCLGATTEFVRTLRSQPPADSSNQRRRRFVVLKTLGLLVLGINAAHMLVVGVYLVLGHYGPMKTLSWDYHIEAFFLFPSVLSTTTILLGLVISQGMTAQADIGMRAGMYAAPIFLIVFEFGTIRLIVPMLDIGALISFSVSLAWCMLAETFGGIYFFTRARYLSSTLQAMGRRSTIENNKKRRLIRWLHITALSMAINVGAALAFIYLLVAGMSPIETAWPWLIGVLVFSLSRVAVAYSQLHVLGRKPVVRHQKVPFRRFSLPKMASWIRGRQRIRRSNTVLPRNPSPSQSASASSSNIFREMYAPLTINKGVSREPSIERSDP